MRIIYVKAVEVKITIAILSPYYQKIAAMLSK